MTTEHRLGAAAALCFLVWMPSFFVCAPWPFAMTPAAAEAKWPGKIDPAWRAVVSDHGRPAGWSLGTIGDNPWGFWLCAAVCVGSFSGAVYCSNQVKRIQTEEAIASLPQWVRRWFGRPK